MFTGAAKAVQKWAQGAFWSGEDMWVQLCMQAFHLAESLCRIVHRLLKNPHPNICSWLVSGPTTLSAPNRNLHSCARAGALPPPSCNASPAGAAVCACRAAFSVSKSLNREEQRRA